MKRYNLALTLPPIWPSIYCPDAPWPTMDTNSRSCDLPSAADQLVDSRGTCRQHLSSLEATSIVPGIAHEGILPSRTAALRKPPGYAVVDDCGFDRSKSACQIHARDSTIGNVAELRVKRFEAYTRSQNF